MDSFVRFMTGVDISQPTRQSRQSVRRDQLTGSTLVTRPVETRSQRQADQAAPRRQRSLPWYADHRPNIDQLLADQERTRQNRQDRAIALRAIQDYHRDRDSQMMPNQRTGRAATNAGVTQAPQQNIDPLRYAQAQPQQVRHFSLSTRRAQENHYLNNDVSGQQHHRIMVQVFGLKCYLCSEAATRSLGYVPQTLYLLTPSQNDPFCNRCGLNHAAVDIGMNYTPTGDWSRVREADYDRTTHATAGTSTASDDVSSQP